MEYVKKYGLIGLIITGIIISVFLPRETPSENTSPLELQSELVEQETYIYVDIKGAVRHPGVYKLTFSSRLFQAVSKAGGLTEEADLLAINLSRILTDEMAIYIPTTSEAYPNIAVESAEEEEGLININLANQTLLETLPGVGPATAESIVSYREENGLFQTINDIMNVPGIGEHTFETLQPLITV